MFLLETLGRWCRRADTGSHHAGGRNAEAVAGDQELDSEDGLNNYTDLEVTGNGNVADTDGGNYAVAEEEGTLTAVDGNALGGTQGYNFRKGKDAVGSFRCGVGVGEGHRYGNDNGQGGKVTSGRGAVNDVAGNRPGLGTGDGLPDGKGTGNKFSGEAGGYGCITSAAFNLEAAVIDLVDHNTFDPGRGRAALGRTYARTNYLLLGADFISHACYLLKAKFYLLLPGI